MTEQHHSIVKRILRSIEYGGLIIITIATLIAGGQEILHMVDAGKVTLADLLLLFIFLEVVAMVGIYLESGNLPVRMPLYIAIVALARYLALDMKAIDSLKILAVAGAILILAASVLLIRYGRARYPHLEGDQPVDVFRDPRPDDQAPPK